MKKEILFIAFSIILLASFASASRIQVTPLNDVIIPEFNQSAQFILNIDGVSSGTYHFYTFADVYLLPDGDFSLTDWSNNLTLSIFPTERIKDHKGFYTFVYNLKQNNGDSDYENKITPKIVPLKDAIEISADTISPDSSSITLTIQNKENAKILGINAKFVSVFFNTEKTFDLTQKKKTEITIPLNTEETKKIKAGLYLLTAEFDTDSGKVPVEGKIYWAEKKGISSQEDTSGFFIKETKITKLNVGNVPQKIDITISKNLISRLFTTFSIEPDAVKNSGFSVIYTWSKELNPTESLVVKASTNYIMPWILLILALIIIYAYIRYAEKKVDVIKSVSHVKTKGGEFALKVRIHVKAKKPIQNVSLVDRMPPMAKVYEKLWTHEPKKIDTINRRIYWDIGDLATGQERVFSYVIYSKIGVLGKFTLPEAMAIFEKGGKIHEISSNKVFFLSEQVKRND